jgi:hypothetical protein
MIHELLGVFSFTQFVLLMVNRKHVLEGCEGFLIVTAVTTHAPPLTRLRIHWQKCLPCRVHTLNWAQNTRGFLAIWGEDVAFGARVSHTLFKLYKPTDSESSITPDILSDVSVGALQPVHLEVD